MPGRPEIPWAIEKSTIVYETERYLHLISYSRLASVWKITYILISAFDRLSAGPVAKGYMKRYRSIVSIDKETGAVELTSMLLAGLGGLRLVFIGKEEPLRELVELYRPHTLASVKDFTGYTLCQGKPILVVPKKTQSGVTRIYFCLLRLAPYYKKYIHLFQKLY